MPDNFDIIQKFYTSLPDAEDSDKFLFGQILVRSKDDSRFAKSNNRIIKDLIFRKAESLQFYKEEIVEICDTLKARAYLNINPRSFKAIAIDMAGLCLDYIRTSGEQAVRAAFATACGRFKPKNNCWIIDIDDCSIEEEVTKYIPEVSLRVPTVNGVHLITKGFDLRELRDKFPTVDIHKNNPTLLYAPFDVKPLPTALHNENPPITHSP